MNPAALLHHPSAFDLSLSSIGQDRPYGSLNNFSTNDYPFDHRRTPNGLTNSALGATLTNSNLDYSTQPSLTDGHGPSHQQPHGVLSPPESLNGALSASSIPSTSPFSYATLPRPNLSNASASDPFAGASGVILSSNWSDPVMTSFDRSRISTIPPPLTPPVTFTSSGIGIPGSSHLLTRPHIDRSYPSYPQQNGMASGYNSMRPLASPFAYRNGTYNAYPHHEHAYHHTVPITHTEQAKPEGPPFEKTVVLREMYSQQNQELKPEISATIQKGFFQVDGKWTCYRRNYFTVACSFSIKPSNGDGRFYISSHKQLRPVEQFAVSISAKTAAVNNQESEQRKLVQHTPKRDKATETEPDRHLVSPAPAHSMHSNSHMNSLVGLMPNAVGSLMHGYANFDSPGQQSPPSSYTFERIQFQKATANNGKRRAQQQYFHVVVELSAFISSPHDGENWVVIATRDSEPMVVRGRSPGHYKDNNRRDSQTSMDRDHNAGGGSDGSSGSYGYAPHHHHHSSMDWSSGRSGHHGHHYHGSGNTYSTRAVSARSPASGSSSTTLTESPTNTDFTLLETDSLKSATFSFEHSTQTTGCDGAEGPLFSLNRSPFSGKRSVEEESSNEETPYQSSPPFCDFVMSNPFEQPGLLHSKALCASS